MTEEKLSAAIKEAERFIERATSAYNDVNATNLDRNKWSTCGKTQAACKRASMDLTRALAELRARHD